MTSTLLDEGVLIPDHFGEAPIPIPDHFGKLPAPIPDLEVQEPLSVPALDVTTVSGWRSFRWSIPLSLAGLAVGLLTACTDQHLDPGLWGLPGSIFPTWYLGLALIVAGIATARRSDGVEIGIAVTSLVLLLTGTAAIVYDIPRLPWAEKHVGVTDYILKYGQVHPDLDIYQAWPGLFSATAWLSRVGGIHDPIAVARVWPPIVNVLELLAVRCFAGRLLGNAYRAWMAAGVFMLAGAFNLDYFSPQAIALLLALSLYAVVVPVASIGSAAIGTKLALPFRLPAWRIGLVVLLSIALAVTHQITPYFVVASLAVLVIFGVLRPVWIPLVPLIPAAVWALINYQAWKSYFSFSDIFNLSANVQTPGASFVGERPDAVLRLSTFALAAGPFIVGVLAVLFLLRHRGRLEFALAACAASAGSLVLITDYGQEGLYRTTLFALPWLCVLAFGNGPKALFRRSYTVVPLIAFLSMSFLFANFALDGMNVVRPSQLQAERTFELTAPLGSMMMYVGANDSPLDATYRYNAVLTSFEIPRGKVSALVTSLIRMGQGYPRFYVSTSEAGVHAGQLYNLYTPRYYAAIDSALQASPQFRMVSDRGGTRVFELRTSARS
ncbi:MAG: hypothetical protein ABSF33_00695 [Acidimicrobiales bacterium]|jgi:hypothetical protein